MDRLAIENFEAPFQLGNLTLAPLIGTTAADLQAEPETAKPTRHQKHDDEALHSRADARSRRPRRRQNAGMVAKPLTHPLQSSKIHTPSTAVALISISASLRIRPATSTPVAAGYGGPLKNSRRTAAVRL